MSALLDVFSTLLVVIVSGLAISPGLTAERYGVTERGQPFAGTG
jgi:uncharacterized membrane protein